jgi:hypothetical protein
MGIRDEAGGVGALITAATEGHAAERAQEAGPERADARSGAAADSCVNHDATQA